MMSCIIARDDSWQVKSASHMTKLLSISRMCTALCLTIEWKMLAPEDKMGVLGVTYDSRMIIRTHTERLTREASGMLASLQRISCVLNSKVLEILYKAQIRFSLEYACLAWEGAASKHLVLLNKEQEQVERLIRDC